MVHSKGMREPAGTLLSTDLAVTSWKVTPANSGVVTERTSPASGRSAGAGAPAANGEPGTSAGGVAACGSSAFGTSACASHLITLFECMFESMSRPPGRLELPHNGHGSVHLGLPRQDGETVHCGCPLHGGHGYRPRRLAMLGHGKHLAQSGRCQRGELLGRTEGILPSSR